MKTLRVGVRFAQSNGKVPRAEYSNRRAGQTVAEPSGMTGSSGNLLTFAFRSASVIIL